MVSPVPFRDALIGAGVELFVGVPDSLLKDFNATLQDTGPFRHVIAANEGAAVAIAAGAYFASGTVPCVYLQNSGLGNTVNPLVSLADPAVYGIPMVLIVGWRGEPGVHDEPQHMRQGAITPALLDTLGVRYAILPDETSEAINTVETLVKEAHARKAPTVLLVKKGVFAPYPYEPAPSVCTLSREEALRIVLDSLPKSAATVATTGMLSRELFEQRELRGEPHDSDFLTVGSMGHSSSIALGIALTRPSIQVYCLDGDGAALMHLGSIGVIGHLAPKNLKHIIFNNEAHDSVGGQPTAGRTVDFPAVAAACGYGATFTAEDELQLVTALQALKETNGPSLLEIRIQCGARSDLGRPTMSPEETKNSFMRFLAS